MLRLVKIGAEGERPCMDVMEIRRPVDVVTGVVQKVPFPGNTGNR
jgi:hypothetical protein